MIHVKYQIEASLMWWIFCFDLRKGVLILPLKNRIICAVLTRTPTFYTMSYKSIEACIHPHLYTHVTHICTGMKDSSPFFSHSSHPADLHQYLRYPTPRTCRQQPDPVWLTLLLCGHLLYGGLWRCHTSDLALSAPGGYHDLCSTHRASHPGKKQSC